MKIKTIAIIALLFVPLLFVLFGCSTSQSTTTTTTTTLPSSLVGVWSGTWTDTNNLQGTLTLVVGSDGSFTGTIHESTYNKDGSSSGTVTASGALSGTFQYTGVSYTMSGNVTTSGSGPGATLTGILNEYSGSTKIGTATINMTKS